MPSPKKSKSPKSKSSKKSPGGKKSPGKKNSPKNQKDLGPPVDSGLQTDPVAVCYFCQRSFKDSAAIQAHIVLMNHMDPFNAMEQQCRACQTIVLVKDVEQHKCAVLKATFLRFVSCSATLVYGPPYRCLFCRSKRCESRVELAMHLLCLHRPNKIAGRCGMCTFTYEEPPPPPPPTIPPLPPNADEERKKAYQKEVQIATEKAMCEPPAIPTPGLDSLRLHVQHEHVPAYTLWSRRNLIEDSNLRYPYACPICGWLSKSNYGFHAHVLCCHGNPTEIQNALKVCAMCGFAAAGDAGLNQHIDMNHVAPIKRLGSLWIKAELLMNVTDPATTCAYCWQTFNYDFQLQAHLLIAHVSKNALRCGWCKVDFLSCPDPVLAFMIMQHHELNHARTLHEVALKNMYTVVPLKDVLPEVPNKEQLIDARLAYYGLRPESPGKKGKGKDKSPKSKSPKSKSPKSKSPKSKSSGSKSKSGSKKK